MKKGIGSVLFCILWCMGSMVLAQGPSTPSLEQVAQMKADLEKQATMGALLNRAATCEAKLLDVPALKARIAELEALQKKAESKPETPSPEAPVKR